MAKIEKQSAETTYVLTLTETEAAYVYAALFQTEPAEGLLGDGREDTVWNALDDALPYSLVLRHEQRARPRAGRHSAKENGPLLAGPLAGA